MHLTFVSGGRMVRLAAAGAAAAVTSPEAAVSRSSLPPRTPPPLWTARRLRAARQSRRRLPPPGRPSGGGGGGAAWGPWRGVAGPAARVCPWAAARCAIGRGPPRPPTPPVLSLVARCEQRDRRVIFRLRGCDWSDDGGLRLVCFTTGLAGALADTVHTGVSC
eukprot:1188826-Prorocentrum_minimum.AAC.1